MSFLTTNPEHYQTIFLHLIQKLNFTFDNSTWNTAQTFTVSGVDDFIDKRKKVVKVSDKVINEFEYYCNKISICVDDPVNKDSCHKII